MARDTIGLYVHFPFCLRKCLYCDFPSYSGQEHLMDRYLEAMKTEIDNIEAEIENREIETIFWGGGTPTLFSGEKLADLLNYIKESFIISQGVEITTEANPETIDEDKLKALKAAGINRLSIGMQAGQDKHIKKLGRVHSLHDVIKSVDSARKVGFKNINLDLMFGLPNQTSDEWMESLSIAVDLGVEHISAYALIIEEGTPFFEMERQGKLNTPSEEVEREMYHKGVEYLTAQGYIQYEISNFAKPGKECRHNLIYWHNEQYIGIGSGAHSSLRGERWSNYSDICQYIDTILQKGRAIEYSQKISKDEQRFETIMMGLRLTKGISKAKFYERFGRDIGYYYRGAIDTLKGQGMLTETPESIYLTPKGLDLQNSVLLYFMD